MLVMVDVLLGLVFVFLLASLATSALAELLESLLKNRSKDLERGLIQLLGPALKSQLLSSPVLRGLASKPGAVPSYLPSRSFALALLEQLAQGAAAAVLGSGSPAPATLASAPAPMTAGATALAVSPDVTVVPAPAVRPDRVAAMLQLPVQQFLASLPDGDLQRALTVVLSQAEGRAIEALRPIEKWFDDAMDQVTGWYKRRTQWILFGLGLLFAAGANLDAINIGQALVSDPSLRQAMVEEVQAYSKTQAEGGGKPADAKEAEARFREVNATLQSLQLPIGWKVSKASEGTEAAPTVSQRQALPNDWASIAMKVLGVLITALATTLGAPFWFDLLKRVMLVRSGLNPDEDSRQKNSKQRAPAE
jgi:hypothetical protein